MIYKVGNFQNILKSLRTSHSLTQDALAKKLKISRSTIGMYESGAREPDFETLELIADFFNVDIDYLLGRTLKTTYIPFNENRPELNKRNTKQIEDKSTSVESEFSPEIRMAARKLKNMKDSDRDITLKIIDYIAGKGKEANEE